MTEATPEPPTTLWLMYAPWLKDEVTVWNVFTTREAAQTRLDDLIERVGPSPIFDAAEIVEYAAVPI